MRTRKYMGLLLAVLALAVMVWPAEGQVVPPSPTIQVLAVTNNVPNSTTTTANLGAVIDCTRYREVAVQVKFALNAAGTTACTFGWNWSADGTNWNTSTTHVISIPPAGTTPVCTNAIIPVGPMPYLKLGAITAGNNTAAMTNISVLVTKKPARLDY